MDTPFWVFLDQLGIVFGLVFAIVEVITLIYVYTISEDVDDIQEDVEELET
jgi:hypothetical protein